MPDRKQRYSGDCGAATDVGAVRETNEDAYSAGPEIGLWLVADGMGGHNCGDVASAITRDTVAAEVSAGGGLTESITSAHKRILTEANERAGAGGMGSTVVAVLLDGNDYEVAWVGDSRAYLWDSQLMQITRDHSYVTALVNSGAIAPEEASTHPSSHLLTRCLGVDDDRPLPVETRRGRFSRGQELLLCSDGLTGELSDEEIGNIVAEPAPSQERVDKLVRTAVDHGGKDNVTAILLSAPENAPGGGEWRKTAGLLLLGAVLAASMLGAVFYLQRHGVF